MKEFSAGQWQVFFKYGPEYGPIIENKEAEFRLFVEVFQDEQFRGRTIDWNGFGAEGEVALVRGFIDGDLISFTKEYKHRLYFDEWGNSVADDNEKGLTVVYEGRFNKESINMMGLGKLLMN